MYTYMRDGQILDRMNLGSGMHLKFVNQWQIHGMLDERERLPQRTNAGAHATYPENIPRHARVRTAYHRTCYARACTHVPVPG